MVKVVCGKSRIGEASYRGEGMGQIVVGEIELGGASWTRINILIQRGLFKTARRHPRYRCWFVIVWPHYPDATLEPLIENSEARKRL